MNYTTVSYWERNKYLWSMKCKFTGNILRCDIVILQIETGKSHFLRCCAKLPQSCYHWTSLGYNLIKYICLTAFLSRNTFHSCSLIAGSLIFITFFNCSVTCIYVFWSMLLLLCSFLKIYFIFMVLFFLHVY